MAGLVVKCEGKFRRNLHKCQICFILKQAIIQPLFKKLDDQQLSLKSSVNHCENNAKRITTINQLCNFNLLKILQKKFW